MRWPPGARHRVGRWLTAPPGRPRWSRSEPRNTPAGRCVSLPPDGMPPGRVPPDGVLRVGIGGPVGSGKTALVAALCRALAGRYQTAVVTNDIYTKEDAEALLRMGVLPPERIVAVETGCCP